MKKYTLLLTLAAVILLALTACNRNGDTQESNADASNLQVNEPTEIFYPDIYLFHESTDMGIYFSIHQAWHMKYGIEETEFEHEYGTTRVVTVYHIATREELGIDNVGMLFNISRFPIILEDGPGVGMVLAHREGYTYAINYPLTFDFYPDSDSIASLQFLNMMDYLTPWDDNFVTNSFRLVGANPFAEALLEFFEGGAETPVGVDATKAFWHTIGDIPIMVAIRHEIRAEETGHDQPIPVARVFYWIGDALSYKDIETYQGGTPLVVISGGLALFGGSWANQWTTLLGIENGNLTRTLTLFYMLDADDISGENPRYYIRHGEWRWQDGYENLTPITQEEFYDILNTREFTRWEDMFDLTERILSGELWSSTIPAPELPTTVTNDTEWPPLQLSIALTPDNAVIIKTNRPLHDFAWVQLEHDFVDDEFVFMPSDIHIGTVAELLPDETFVINNFMDYGTMPTNAVTFTDQYGARRYFAFQQDNSLDLAPSPFMLDFLDSVVDGRVRIYATTGDGSRTNLGYFDVDIDNFDPDVWLVENSYRWTDHAMVMWELHNIR